MGCLSSPAEDLQVQPEAPAASSQEKESAIGAKKDSAVCDPEDSKDKP